MSNTLGVVLLSSDGNYLSVSGKLPQRPDFDKQFLLNLVEGKKVLCSKNTLINLPKSVINQALHITTDPLDTWDVNLGIATFDYLVDTLYVVRSDYPLIDGRPFRISENYKQILKLPNFEIYTLQEN